MNRFQNWLEQRCTDVRRLEEHAAQMLQENAVEEYRRVMLKKAKLLASLAREGEPLLETLPAQAQEKATEALGRFSHSAFQAISLNSVFYMSALLFPDDYKPGNPNDLEQFALEMQMFTQE